MKSKAIIPLALGLGMGLLAIKFGMDTVKKARGASVLQSRNVLRARQDIDPTVALTQEMLEVVATADKPSPTDPDFSDIKTLVGRVTSKAIPQGATILKSMLAEPGTPPGVPGRIAPGYRAVSVEIDEVTGVAFNVRPGDWVDVIVVMDLPQQGTREKETIAEVVLHRIEVAAVGMGTPGVQKGNAAKGKIARSATLLVPEADVPKLHLAATRGKITLAMRGDEEVTVNAQSYTARSSEILNAASSRTDTKAASLTDSGDTPKPIGILSLMANWFKSSSTPPPPTQTHASGAPEASPRPAPFSMILSYGSTTPGGRTQTYRIVYENGRSNNVLAVHQGPQISSNSLFLRGAAPPQVGAGSAQPQPAGSADADIDVDADDDDWSPDDMDRTGG